MMAMTWSGKIGDSCQKTVHTARSVKRENHLLIGAVGLGSPDFVARFLNMSQTGKWFLTPWIE